MGDPFFAITDVGRTRSVNQDRVAARRLGDGSVLLVVADGVGGMAGGETASAMAVDALLYFLGEGAGDDPPAAIARAVAEANLRVQQHGRDTPEVAGLATTVVVAVVVESGAWLMSLGDSRAYRCTPSDIELITEDDSWIADQLKTGAMTEEEAARSPYQNAITRGVGVEEAVGAEDVQLVGLAPGDLLLLCSDGLYRHVSNDEMLATVKSAGLEDAAHQLVKMANDGGGSDNISVVLYRHS